MQLSVDLIKRNYSDAVIISDALVKENAFYLQETLLLSIANINKRMQELEN